MANMNISEQIALNKLAAEAIGRYVVDTNYESSEIFTTEFESALGDPRLWISVNIFDSSKSDLLTVSIALAEDHNMGICWCSTSNKWVIQHNSRNIKNINTEFKFNKFGEAVCAALELRFGEF